MIAAPLFGSASDKTSNEIGESVRSKRGFGAALAMSTDLVIVLRHDPRWRRGLACRTVLSGDRESACPALLTDRFPATVDRQAIHLGIDFPDVSPLNQWLPFVRRLPAPLHRLRLASRQIPSGGHRGSALHRSDRAPSMRTLRLCSGRSRVCAFRFMRSRWRPIAVLRSACVEPTRTASARRHCLAAAMRVDIPIRRPQGKQTLPVASAGAKR